MLREVEDISFFKILFCFIVTGVGAFATHQETLGIFDSCQFVDTAVANGHAHAGIGGVVGADAVEDETIDEQHAPRGHGHGNRLSYNAGIYDPGLPVDVVQVVEAGQQVRTGDELGAAVIEMGFFEVENDRGQWLAPLSDVAVEVVGIFRCQVEGGVVVAVFDNFDVGAKDGFQGVEDGRTGGDSPEEGILAIQNLGDAHGATIGAADDGLDFFFEFGPYGGFELFYSFPGQGIGQFEETIVAKKADFF